MHLLIDADILVYRCGFAAEKMRYSVLLHGEDLDGGTVYTFDTKKEVDAFIKDYQEWEFSVVARREAEPVENALHNVRSVIETIEAALAPDEFTLVRSGDTNFRLGVATIKPYKGNRDANHKPVHGPAIKEYMDRTWPIIVSEDEEADDVIAYTHMRRWREDDMSSVIVSTDKDLDMIPGLHYDWVKEQGYIVSQEDAMRWFFTQMLTGDAVDNIPGVPGIGPKKAARALEGATTQEQMLEVVRTLYVQSYGVLADDALLENGRLLWMRREPHQIWTPDLQIMEG